jgi:predicted ArsR family transcriptional regulator
MSAKPARTNGCSETRNGVATIALLARRRLLKLLQNGPLTRSELVTALDTDISQVELMLESLREQHLVAISGFGRSGEFGLTRPKWRLTNKGRRSLRGRPQDSGAA